MISYFRELLATLKAIEAHLAALAACTDRHPHRWDRRVINTWDKRGSE